MRLIRGVRCLKEKITNRSKRVMARSGLQVRLFYTNIFSPPNVVANWNTTSTFMTLRAFICEDIVPKSPKRVTWNFFIFASWRKYVNKTKFINEKKRVISFPRFCNYERTTRKRRLPLNHSSEKVVQWRHTAMAASMLKLFVNYAECMNRAQNFY